MMLITSSNLKINFNAWWPFNRKSSEQKQNELVLKSKKMLSQLPDEYVASQGITQRTTSLDLDDRKAHMDLQVNVNNGDHSVELSRIIDLD